MTQLFGKITDRVGVWLVNLVLLGLLAQTIASFTWQILEDDKQQQTQKSSLTPVKTRPTQQSAILMAQRIANSHLFGRADVKAVTQRGVTAPETKLNLLLKGVIASPDKRQAVAFVAAGRGAVDKAYGIGENLPGGAILKEIYEDRILLEYRGRMENLTLRRKLLTNKELGIQ